MSFGLEVYDENGNKTLSIDDTTIRILYCKYVTAYESGSVYLPEVDGKNVFYFSSLSYNSWMNSLDPILVHKVTRVENTFYWEPQGWCWEVNSGQERVLKLPLGTTTPTNPNNWIFQQGPANSYIIIMQYL